MLMVKIQNGDEMERTFYVNDLQDLKRVQDNLVDEFQKVLAQDELNEKIELERVLEASPCDNADELIALLGDIADVCKGDLDVFREIKDMKDELDGSDYDSIGDILDEIERMGSALSDIYYTARDFN